MTKFSQEEAALRPEVIRRRLSPWLVPAMEAIGYVLCGLIGVGFAYSLVAKVDVLVPCEGPLVAPRASVIASADAVVAEWMVQPGQKVDTGEPLCTLAIDPPDQGRVRAQYFLKAASESLSTGSGSQSQAVVTQIQAALAALGGPERLQTLNAPGPGVVSAPAGTLRAKLLKQGEVIVSVIDVSRLDMTGMVAAAQANKVALGCRAQVTTPRDDISLQGYVADVSKETPGRVTLHFEPIPDILQQDYVREFLSSDAVVEPGKVCRAQIVVGKTSLFRHLFGRR